MQLYRADNNLLPKDKIQGKKIVFIGVGSLGSLTIAQLAYPFREIVLVDPDVLARENIERHVLGYSSVGRPKVEAMADWLVDRGISPSKIKAFQSNAEEVLDDHKDADLVIVTTGTGHVCEYVNSWVSCPVIYGGHFENKQGGEVIVLPSPKQVCYLCAQFLLGRESREHTRACGVVDPDAETDKYFFYLRYSVDLIASWIAHFALLVLKGGGVQAQVFVLAYNNYPALELEEGGALEAVTPFVSAQEGLGLVPSLSLGMTGESITLNLHNTTVSYALSEWNECPLHETDQLFLAEEI